MKNIRAEPVEGPLLEDQYRRLSIPIIYIPNPFYQMTVQHREPSTPNILILFYCSSLDFSRVSISYISALGTVCILLTGYESTVALVLHHPDSSPGRERRLHDIRAALKRGKEMSEWPRESPRNRIVKSYVSGNVRYLRGSRGTHQRLTLKALVSYYLILTRDTNRSFDQSFSFCFYNAAIKKTVRSAPKNSQPSHTPVTL